MVTIAEFHESFLKAEEEIKLAELFIDGLASVKNIGSVSEYQPRGVVIPAINELRYAAKHLSCAMQEDTSEKNRQEQIVRASRHCIRARLDALRALILYLVRDFHQFTSFYRMSNVSAEDRERFNAHRKTVWDVMCKLSKDRSRTTDEDCDNLKAAIEKLHDVYLDVKKFRDVFDQLRSEMRAGTIVGIAVGIAGIVIGVILYCLSR